jgi:type III pantothenate kinase
VTARVPNHGGAGEAVRRDAVGRDAPAGTAPLLVLVDVGNTNIVFGVYRGEELVESFRVSTAADRTADELGALLLPLFDRSGLDPRAAEGVMVSSVVPPLDATLDRLARRFFGREATFVAPGIKTGLPMLNENPAEVGADRIVNAVAARELYGTPVVVVDFGTATTFDVVTAAGEYAGGIICPGIGISAEALFAHASRLYRVDIRKPSRVIGRNTVGAMQSGIYFGYIGLVDGILARLAEELPGLSTVVATGGLAELIADGSERITRVEPLLTLIGLKMLWERNRPGVSPERGGAAGRQQAGGRGGRRPAS